MQLLTYFIYITATLLCLYLLLINLYLYWFSKLRIFNATVIKPVTRFTVIIPARNEEENIENCIRSILNNNYPEDLFEIIVADDFSTDRTPGIVHALQTKYSNIHIISLKNIITETINSYKKRAIELAIAQSKYEWIITTDADCIVPQQWLQLFDAYIQKNNRVFIAAPVMFTCNNSFLDIFQCLDFLSLQGITAASVYAGAHSMCNGANLAYKKSVFYEVDGFKNADHIASGDDMLLMHKIKTKYPENIGYLFSDKIIVTTPPMPDLNSFLNQRIRWASKATSYKDKRVFWVLLLVYFLNLFLLVLFIASFFRPQIFLVWLSFILFKALLEMPFMYRVSKFYSLQRLMLSFVLMQPFHILYTVISGWLGTFGTYKWKGRKVR
ncbi:glycosyltransferase [Parafilimonas terrae]|uniref:Glycosyltransferase, catalytic subunit of cellulose synthase and poly-beta-1,6-N-acetylglucosamine synthase n=1 Tax=Parafilimonas terrae TaxID=1465490 RepID=A0A1I5XMG2_9BACT|nr:glycosyltransferase [Parafilimonas terrae]SFQ32907.1 Glycosyltransferase, catalytic subunit of cellulose synthase and poly-beta-1,6-N-acetylglucosamine synthase [Parafilimonas terrae]